MLLGGKKGELSPTSQELLCWNLQTPGFRIPGIPGIDLFQIEPEVGKHPKTVVHAIRFYVLTCRVFTGAARFLPSTVVGDRCQSFMDWMWTMRVPLHSKQLR